MEEQIGRLSEDEVKKRLEACSDPKVIEEIYAFGQKMLEQTIANVRVLDNKAASLAAYGGAIVTLLVSTSGGLAKSGDRWTYAAAAFAGIAAFLGAISATFAMALREHYGLGEREWLEESCLADVNKLKKYRVLTIWGAMDSYKIARLSKIRKLKVAQRLLATSVFSLLFVLLQVACLLAFHEPLWLAWRKLFRLL